MFFLRSPRLWWLVGLVLIGSVCDPIFNVESRGTPDETASVWKSSATRNRKEKLNMRFTCTFKPYHEGSQFPTQIQSIHVTFPNTLPAPRRWNVECYRWILWHSHPNLLIPTAAVAVQVANLRVSVAASCKNKAPFNGIFTFNNLT